MFTVKYKVKSIKKPENNLSLQNLGKPVLTKEVNLIVFILPLISKEKALKCPLFREKSILVQNL